MHYGEPGGKFVIIVNEFIVGFDEDKFCTRKGIESSCEHDRKIVRAVIVRRSLSSRIFSLFLLDRDNVIYLAPGYRVSN